MSYVKYGTPYQETEAILAAQEGDISYLIEVLADMLPGERRRLAEAADLLSGMAEHDQTAGEQS